MGGRDDDSDDDGDSSRWNNRGGGSTSLSAILDSWTRELARLRNDRIAGMFQDGGGDFEHMRVDREDVHETLLACRLDPSPEEEGAGEETPRNSFSLQEDEGEETPDDKTEEGAARDEVERCLQMVECRLALLERRLRKCPLESLRVFRETTKETPVYADPTVMARGVGGRAAGRNDGALQPSRGLILTISVYSTSRPGVVSQTFEVRAEQHLSDLRDRISCLTDRAMVELREHGTAPKAHLPLPQLRGQGTLSHISICPSSAYFLIEGVFYVDAPPAQANATDPSQEIRSWIAEDQARRRHFGQIDPRQVHSMRETCWIDLALRVNRPYLAIHCGRCEHYFVVDKIRLEHEYDRASLFDHPPSEQLPSATAGAGQNSGIREVYRMRRRRRKCRFCDAGRVTWVTVNDRLAPDNPCWYCDTCYRLLHYDRDGRLIYGGYRVYPYFYDIH